MVGPANREMVFVIKPATREVCGSERLRQPLHAGASFEVVLFPFFPSSQRCWLGLVVWIIDFVISCLQPYCSLHLHLHVSANPYTSGNIASRESAPGIIVASGGWEGNLFASGVLFLCLPESLSAPPTTQNKITLLCLFQIFLC